MTEHTPLPRDHFLEVGAQLDAEKVANLARDRAWGAASNLRILAALGTGQVKPDATECIEPNDYDETLSAAETIGRAADEIWRKPDV